MGLAYDSVFGSFLTPKDFPIRHSFGHLPIPPEIYIVIKPVKIQIVWFAIIVPDRRPIVDLQGPRTVRVIAFPILGKVTLPVPLYPAEACVRWRGLGTLPTGRGKWQLFPAPIDGIIPRIWTTRRSLPVTSRGGPSPQGHPVKAQLKFSHQCRVRTPGQPFLLHPDFGDSSPFQPSGHSILEGKVSGRRGDRVSPPVTTPYPGSESSLRQRLRAWMGNIVP